MPWERWKPRLSSALSFLPHPARRTSPTKPAEAHCYGSFRFHVFAVPSLEILKFSQLKIFQAFRDRHCLGVSRRTRAIPPAAAACPIAGAYPPLFFPAVTGDITTQELGLDPYHSPGKTEACLTRETQ